MLLKRNLLSIIYSVLFVGIWGIAFLEISQLAISDTKNSNVVACILVLGIAIYMIGSFFIKEAGYVDFIQRKSRVANMVEILFFVVVCALLFVLDLPIGLTNSLLLTVLMAGVYVCARMLGGRLCGCAALVLGFFYFHSIANSSFTARQYIDIFCFVIPYAVFLLVTRKFVYMLSDNSFMLFFSYFVMGIVFSLAIILNPLACALLVGCILTLIFGEPENKKCSVLCRGVPAAGILTLISVIIFGVIFFLLPDMIVLPEMAVDPELASYTDLSQIFDYMILKFTDAMQFVYSPFHVPVFPVLMVFLGCTAGFFSIRRSSSGIGPFCLTYIILLGYYLIFNKNGAHFYYMTYMLPIFTAYGFSCTLVLKESTEPAEQTDTASEQAASSAKGAEAATSVTTEAMAGATTFSAEPEGAQGGQKEQPGTRQAVPGTAGKAQAAGKPDKKAMREKQAAEKKAMKERQAAEKADKKAMGKKQTPPPQKKQQTEKPDKSKEDAMRRKAAEIDNSVELQPAEPAAWNVAEIPEWTVSPDFMPGAKQPQAAPEAPSPSGPELKLEPNSEATLEAKPQAQSPSTDATTLSAPSAPSSSNKIEVAGLGAETLSSSKNYAVGSPEILEQSDVASSQANSAVMPDYQSLNSDDVLPASADSLIHSPESMDFAPEEEPLLTKGDVSDSSDENEDAQLDTLLARLDMSDPIRRMNETAREDIADVIEREDEQKDLRAAIPAAELDYEEPADESDAMLDLDLMTGAEEDDESANLDLMPEMDTETENESVTLDLMPESELQMQFPEMEWGSEPEEEIKLEPQPQAAPELDLQLEPQPQAAPEPEVAYEPEPELKLEPQPQVSRSTLPKYVKPDFDFKAEPLTRPLTGDEAMISEYDKVPTITDLEHKWREVHAADNIQPEQEPLPVQEPVPEYTPEPQPEPLSALEPKLEPLMGYTSELQPEPLSALEPKLEFTAMPEYTPEPEPLSERESELEPMPEYTPEPQPEPLSASGMQLEYTPEPEPLSEWEPELEPMPEYAPKPQAEPRTSGFAYSLDEVSETLMRPEKTETNKNLRAEKQVHTEEIVKRTAGGKRSYHRITLG